MSCYLNVSSGIRAAALARPFLSELGLVPLPSAVIIPQVQSSGIDPEGEIVDNDRVSNNAEKLCKSVVDNISYYFFIFTYSRELLWYADALNSMKEKSGYPN